MRIYEVFEDEHKYYIVIELMKGLSLCEYIANVPQGQLTEAIVAGIMRQVLSGLNFCHLQGIAHRDIKPENLMFADKECTVLKIIDFGFAKLFKKDESKFKEILGSPMYMAPEIIIKQEYNEKCDIWSCGIMCFMLLSGNMPYKMGDDDPLDALFAQIRTKTFTQSDLIISSWQHISPEARSFVLMLLEREPEKRPAAKDVLTHPWLTCAKKENLDPEEAKRSLERLLRNNVFLISAVLVGAPPVPACSPHLHSLPLGPV